MATTGLGIIIIILFLLMIFYKSTLHIKQCDRNYLCVEKSNSVKAICAISVMLHHITNEVYCGILYLPFQMIGYLMVAVFFFYSGYGIMYSYKTKEKYMENFLKRRILTVLIPYLIAIIIYVLIKSFFYGFNIINILNSFISGSPIANNSWFVVSLLILYIIFWLSFRWTKNQKLSWVVFLILFLVYFISYRFVYWSPTLIAFLAGMIWSYFKEQMDLFLFKYNIFVLSSLFLCFVVFFVLKLKFNSGISESVIQVFSSLFFAPLVICLQTRITLNNKILAFLSRISFEIYLYHGLAIFLIKKTPIFECNCNMFLLSVSIMTIVVSIVMSYLNKMIIKKISVKNK